MSPLKRIAIFYDGTFFMNTSQFYKHDHGVKKFIDFNGFADYARDRVAEFETGGNINLCHVVASHFFRGRFKLESAQQKNVVESDRYIDQLMMFATVTPHHFPMDERSDPPVERGIDVWFALEAYEYAVTGKCDILVLFAGDKDYLPLVRKLNGLGVRVVAINVDLDFEYSGNRKFIKTSHLLLSEAPYVANLSDDIDRYPENIYVKGLFK